MNDSRLELPVVMYEVTHRCNYACRYCYNDWKRWPASGEAAGDDAYARNLCTLKQLFRAAKVRQIGMTGGEPFLAERFAELVLFCRMQGAAVSIISNGSDHRPYRLMRELGVTQLTLPLHAAAADVHDRMTGADGSWFRSLHAIRHQVALGGRVVASMILTAENWDQVAGVLRLCRDLGVGHVMINRFNIGGAGIREARRLLPAPDRLREAYATASRLGVRLGLTLSSNVGTPQCLIDPDHYPGVHFTGCSVDPLRRPLTLAPDGDLRSCNHSPVVVGNIFTTAMAEILRNARDRCSQQVVPDICAACHRYALCLGGCRAAAEQVGLPVHAADPVLNCLVMGSAATDV